MTEKEWEDARRRERRRAAAKVRKEMGKERKDSGFSAETAVSTSSSHSSTAGESGEVRTRDFAVVAEQEEEDDDEGRAAKLVRKAGRSNVITNKPTKTREMAETPRKTPGTPATSVAIKAGKDDSLVFGLRRLKVTAFSKLAGGKA
ncbi:hypothetical protein LTR86_001794 [Recurvomyces mirabilis]|nr:hypothetical protein LTR86_001794 [Recurvomyces mirabilis]